jgi:hypothetical protein
MTWWLSSSSLILMMGAGATCCASLIYAFCSSMRLSRCSRIKCCCFECIRDVETAEEMAMELEHQQQPQSQPQSTNI